MKVKRLIEILKSMPQEANVKINLRQSTMMIDIDRVNKYKTKCLGKDIDSVEIIADWRDFELDEEEMQLCEQEYDEERRPEEDGHDDMDKADQWYDEQQDRLASVSCK